MKKFLLIAGFAVALTGTALAHGGGYGHQHNGNCTHEDDNCVMCDEDSPGLEIEVCATVNVPLTITKIDDEISFPCLYRFEYIGDGFTESQARALAHLDPSSGSTQNSGRLAKVRFGGDENDDIMVYTRNGGAGTHSGQVLMTHSPYPGQVSDGVNNPTSFVVDLSASYDYAGLNSPTTPDGFPTEELANTELAFDSPGGSNPQWGVGPLQLGNGNIGGVGVGAVNVWLGGTANLQAGQQRGHYSGDFEVFADYWQ